MIVKNSITKKNQGYFLAFIIALLCVTVFSSCRKDRNDDFVQPDIAGVKFVHSLTDVSALDFYVGNERITVPALQYTQSTNYVGLFVGTAPFFAVLGGTFEDLARRDVVLEKDKRYTLFATNVSASNDSVTMVLTEDDLSVPSAGKAKVRFVNLSKDTPQPLDLAVQGQPALFSNQPFQASTAFTEIDPATYTFEIRDTGTSTARASSQAISIAAGNIYTIWSKGRVEGAGVNALGVHVSQN